MATSTSRSTYDAGILSEREKNGSPPEAPAMDQTLPRTRQDIIKAAVKSPKVRDQGESGRRGFHPLHFFKIVLRSSSYLSLCVNVLWPLVPAAIAVYYRVEDQHVLKFTLAYLAMVPCANLIKC